MNAIKAEVSLTQLFECLDFAYATEGGNLASTLAPSERKVCLMWAMSRAEPGGMAVPILDHVPALKRALREVARHPISGVVDHSRVTFKGRTSPAVEKYGRFWVARSPACGFAA